MIRTGRASAPFLYVLLALLFGPMVLLGVLWVTFVLTGLMQTPDLENLQDAILVWMTMGIAAGAVCVLAEALIAPFVLRLVKLPAHWVRGILYFVCGALAAATAYVLLTGAGV